MTRRSRARPMELIDTLALVGRTIDEKYLVEELVGQGGFAAVYRALHLAWRRPVALKVFRALEGVGTEQRETLLAEFVREGAILAELSERTSAIVQARDLGVLTTAAGTKVPYMVLEWLEGRSLDRWLEERRARGEGGVRVAAALAVLAPIAEALGLAHSRGIAHRDVKPANIHVVGDLLAAPTIKLLDFGIAKVVQDAQKTSGAFQQTTGDAKSFTPAYGAPEQFARSFGPTGPWTDVFALALVFVELVTGREALAGDDIAQLAFASTNRAQRPTLAALGAPYHEGLERVLSKALSVDPAARHESASAFWADLSRAAAEADAVASAGSTSARGSSRDSERQQYEATVAAAPNESRAREDVAVTVSSERLPRRTALARGLGLGAAALALAAVLGVAWSRRDPPAPIAPPASAPAPSPAASTPAPPSCPETMVLIPGGMFFMGSDERDATDDERPAHKVILSPYCLDRYEVTAASYKACSDRGACRRAPRENEWPGISATDRRTYDPLCTIASVGKRDAKPLGDTAELPINCVDWQLAHDFCATHGKRLPTEAEWELAARGPDGRIYPWGDEAPGADRLNACGTECVRWAKGHPASDTPRVAMHGESDGYATLAPVGRFPKGASRYGVHDVVGNVFEWVADWHAPYSPSAPSRDPSGPSAGSERVMRGGAWNGTRPAWVRPTFRFAASPTLRSHGIGFRCAASVDGG